MSKLRRTSFATTLILLVGILMGCGSDSTEPPTPTLTTAASVSTPPGSPPPTPNSTPAVEPTQSAAQTADQSLEPTPPGGIPTAQPPQASSFDVDGDGGMNRDELHTALVETESQYPLPDGYTLDIEKLYQDIAYAHPIDARHENLAEHTILGKYHMCAWGQTWLDAHTAGDQQTMDIAMNQLQTVTLNRPNNAGVREHFSEVFELAKLGDRSGLQQLIEANCNWERFETTPESDLVGPPATDSLDNINRVSHIPDTSVSKI